MSPSSARKPVSRQEPRRQKTRAALLAAGLRLLADRPIDAIAIDDIVQRAGVAKGSFFNHFADKDAFAAAIVADIRGGVEDKITRANRDVADPALRVVRGVCCFVQFALTERPAAKIFARLQSMTADANRTLNRGVLSDVTLGLTQNRFKLANAETGLVYIVGIAQGLLTAVISGRLSSEAARTLTVNVLALLLAGFGIEQAEARRLAADAAGAIIA